MYCSYACERVWVCCVLCIYCIGPRSHTFISFCILCTCITIPVSIRLPIAEVTHPGQTSLCLSVYRWFFCIVAFVYTQNTDTHTVFPNNIVIIIITNIIASNVFSPAQRWRRRRNHQEEEEAAAEEKERRRPRRAIATKTTLQFLLIRFQCCFVCSAKLCVSAFCVLLFSCCAVDCDFGVPQVTLSLSDRVPFASYLNRWYRLAYAIETHQREASEQSCHLDFSEYLTFSGFVTKTNQTKFNSI